MAALRKLLTEKEYRKIVKQGPEAMAEALREYVMKEPGRPAIGEKPMTPADWQRRYRANKRAQASAAKGQ